MSTSLPGRKADVDARVATPAGRAELFVSASIEGRQREAMRLLEAFPDVAGISSSAAAVLGDAERVRERLACDPGAATAIDEVRGWPALLYACYSRWHQTDPGREAGMVEVVRLLLDAGASPDTNDGAWQDHRSALKGAVELNKPEAVRILLEAGADPDRGRPIVDAAGLGDGRCLELLLSHGAKVLAGTWTVGAAVSADDAQATSALLTAMQRANGPAAREATEALPDAAAEASVDVVAALLAAGGDPAAYDDDRAMSALRRAMRAGNDETVALLVGAGAADDGNDVDRLIGACRRADCGAAGRLCAARPDLLTRLDDADRSAIVEAAGSASLAAVQLMLDLGFPPNARSRSGEQPLHAAAYAGNPSMVRLLIGAGGDVSGRDANFDATPLAFATVGSGECAGQEGDWIEVARTLLDAGASPTGVWIADKPPSEDVADLLRSLGVTPVVASESAAGGDDLPEPSPGAGVMADVAQQLEAAYGQRDLELLGSLLHPDVRWSGACTGRTEVLAWYRSLLDEGVGATVESVEVDGDAVVLGIGVARQAEGARSTPGDLLYQVFTVDASQVIDIRVYPDRASALDRPTDG